MFNIKVELLKQNKSHGFEVMHIRVNKNVPYANKIKNITPVVYSECNLKVRYSSQLSGYLRAGMLTSATNKCMCSSMKLGIL